jgi:O-antigen/teichoic acid export membrane protein
VLRNAAYLLAGRVVAAPLAVLVNAIAARRLGAADFGRLYQVMTFTTFAFLFVEWGQASTLSGKVAAAHARAGQLLGSGLVWRVAVTLVALTVLPVACALRGYDREFIGVLVLALLASGFSTLALACQDVLRGFERTDFAAGSDIAYQLLVVTVVVPTLLLGGHLTALLIAQGSCAALGALIVLALLPRLGIAKLSVRFAVLKELFHSGRVFLAFSVILYLQSVVDVGMMSRFASADAMGWFAAARKLVGILVFPASALLAALYPTLCRLHASDLGAYRATGAEALHTVAVVVMPVALGCALFPDLGIMIFSQASYAPAQGDLRLLAIYVLFVYFSMSIGACLASSGRQMAWAALQSVCVMISALCDPPLIRWFQAELGNGGLGVCVTTAVSESLMVVGGLALLPPGLLDRALLRKLAAALAAGAVMALCAWLTSALPQLARAALAVLVYGLSAFLLGAIDGRELREFAGSLRRR